MAYFALIKRTNVLISVSSPAMKAVSIVIPVYNDQQWLPGCIAALSKQEDPGIEVQIIVVDNGSNPPVQLPAIPLGLEVSLLHEPMPSVYAARNKGIAAATGDVVAFLDVDCRTAPDWLRNGILYLKSHPECDILGGRIDVVASIPSKPSLVERYHSIVGENHEALIRKTNGISGANSFIRSNVFKQVGVFDSSIKSRGDVRWGKQAAALGHSICYAPDVRVDHPAFSSLRALIKRHRRLIGGLHAEQVREHPGFTARMRDVRKDLRLPLRTWWIRKKEHGFSFFHWLAFVSIASILRFVRIVERTRFLLGGMPARK